MIEYMIVQSKFIDKFLVEVRTYIEDGWEPQGGLTVDTAFYYQAMIREDEELKHGA